MDQGNPVATPALLHIMLMMLRAASWPLPFWEPIIAFRLRISVPWQHIHGNSCLQWTATIKNLNDSILVPTSSVYFLLPCWRKCPLSPLREVIMWWGLRFYKVNTLHPSEPSNPFFRTMQRKFQYLHPFYCRPSFCSWFKEPSQYGIRTGSRYPYQLIESQVSGECSHVNHHPHLSLSFAE